MNFQIKKKSLYWKKHAMISLKIIVKKIGYDKEGDKCVRRFYIHLYRGGEIDFTPVILYSDKMIHEIDFKRLGITKDKAQKYEEDFYMTDDVFNNLEKFCYVLHDGKNYQELMIDLSQNDLTREDLIKKVNTIFFITPLKESLENNLENKQSRTKIKI